MTASSLTMLSRCRKIADTTLAGHEIYCRSVVSRGEAMTKVWDGPTPYDAEWAAKPHPNSKRPYLHGKRIGYANAMNSPTVVAMYETLIWAAMLVMDEWEGTKGETAKRERLYKPLSAYEAGLKEPADERPTPS